jgi:hypothetical protein
MEEQHSSQWSAGTPTPDFANQPGAIWVTWSFAPRDEFRFDDRDWGALSSGHSVDPRETTRQATRKSLPDRAGRLRKPTQANRGSAGSIRQTLRGNVRFCEKSLPSETAERIVQLSVAERSLARPKRENHLGPCDDGMKHPLENLEQQGRLSRVDPTKSGNWETKP